MQKIFRVNMSDLTTKVEEVPTAWTGLGGRGLTSTIVAQEVPPACHPLGENNKLVFAPGLLTGTTAASSGRLSAGGKSPLTGTIKESNAGGTVGQILARLGVTALIIEGKPKDNSFYGLHVTNDGIVINEETELVGQGNFAVIDSVTKRFGKNVGVLTIGRAGEMKMSSANISVKDPEGKIRSHGRGGLGAVMGAKRIKFIVLDDSNAPKNVHISNPEKFKAAARIFAQTLLKDELLGQVLPAYGTAVNLNALNAAGALPTRNFRFGQFEGHDNISGETLHETIVKRGGKFKHPCHAGCVIQCSQVYTDKKGEYVTSGIEYETIWGLGAHSLVDNLDIIAQADNIMDDIGVDSIEMTVALGVAMEAEILPYGDGEGVIRLLTEDVTKGTPLGRVLGCGPAAVGHTYGVTRIPVVKGQAIPAYDPRGVKGMGITYATSTMGADHTAGYTVSANLSGEVPALGKEGQVELSRAAQIATAAVDSTGLCLFCSMVMFNNPECMGAVLDMINARFDIGLGVEQFNENGMEILKTEHAFNLAAGFTSVDDRLPEFFKEPLPPHNSVWDFSDEEVAEFWNF
jgi:aldehyde:ferredoxin oxidoreductase